MRTRRSLIPIAGGVIVVAALVYAFLPRPVEVDVVSAARHPIVVTVDEEGRTRVTERYTLSAPVAGHLARIDAKPGTPVKAGEIVARIRPSAPAPLDARTTAQWTAREQAAEASLQTARARAQRARAALQFAAGELDRRTALVAAGAAAKRELDQAATEKDAAEAELGAAEASIRVAEHELEEVRAVLTGASDGRLAGDVVPVRAPRAGVLLRVFEESERVVSPGTPLVEIGDPTGLEIVVDLLSTDAVKVRPGARVIIDRWGGETPLEGRVRLIEPSSFTKISALGVEEQRVNVLIDLASAASGHTRLGDRFAVEARIVIDERPSALTVPTSALVRNGDAWSVFVASPDGRARRRAVTIGLRNGLDAEIVEGLHEGDVVIVHPGDDVRDGVAVVRRE